MQGLARRLRGHSHCNPSWAEQNRTEPNLTAWVVRSFTDPPSIPLQVSSLPTPFWSLRVALDASRRFAVFVRNEHDSRDYSRRVSFPVRYSLIHDVSCRDWPDALGIFRNAARTEQNRTKSDRLSSAQLYGHSVYIPRANQFVPSASLLSRHVASLLLCGLSVAFLGSHSSHCHCLNPIIIIIIKITININIIISASCMDDSGRSLEYNINESFCNQ